MTLCSNLSLISTCLNLTVNDDFVGDASIEILEHRVKNKLSNQVMEFDGKNWKTFPPMAVRRCGAVAAYVQSKCDLNLCCFELLRS